MKSKNKYHKLIFIALLIICLFLIINLFKEKKILINDIAADLQYKIEKNKNISSFSIINDRDIGNNKIIIYSYVLSDINYWGYAMYKLVDNGTYCIFSNSFAHDSDDDIKFSFVASEGSYLVECKLDGTITIIQE